jgi:LEA14-like dessication related protein
MRCFEGEGRDAGTSHFLMGSTTDIVPNIHRLKNPKGAIVNPRPVISRALTKGITLLFICLLSACANLQPNFETPTVKLINIKPLKSSGLEQRFSIDLRITNPNAGDIHLVGMSYVIELDGYKVMTGVANDTPTIKAYDDTEFEVQASVSLLKGIGLIASLLKKNKPDVSYRVTTKLDTGIPIIGAIAVTDTGSLSLDSFKH